MRILIATPELAGPGGVQSYVMTIAPHLERLGHEVTTYCRLEGAMAGEARERGLQVVCGEQALPSQIDVVYSQTAPLALRMAELYPHAARVIAVHSGSLDLHLPIGLEGVVSKAVVFNDATAERVRAMANPPPVVRLRQPIEYTLLTSAASPRPHPGTVLALGNSLGGVRRSTLIALCEQLGLSWQEVGIMGTPLIDPLPAIARADIVIGMGRSILDAMSCGRPSWVYGPGGGDGWVTEDSYARLEADGFRGFATGSAPDAAAFRRGLEDYDPEMGVVARSLVIAHHSPYDHATALVGLFTGTAVEPPPDAPLREMAQLIRIAYQHQAQNVVIRRELETLALTHRDEVEQLLAAHRAEIEQHWSPRATEAEALLAEHRVVQARHDAEVQRLVSKLELLTGTRRWRAMNSLLRPLDRLRGR